MLYEYKVNYVIKRILMFNSIMAQTQCVKIILFLGLKRFYVILTENFCNYLVASCKKEKKTTKFYIMLCSQKVRTTSVIPTLFSRVQLAY